MSAIKDLGAAPSFDDEEDDILADIDADAIVRQHSTAPTTKATKAPLQLKTDVDDDVDIDALLAEAESLTPKKKGGVWENDELDMPTPKKGGVWEGSDDEAAPKPKKGGVWEGDDDEPKSKKKGGVWENDELDMPKQKKKGGVWEGSDDEDDSPKKRKKRGSSKKKKSGKKKGGVWEGSDNDDDDDDEKFDDDDFHQGVKKNTSNKYHQEAMKNRMKNQSGGRIQQSQQVLKDNTISRFVSDGLDSSRISAHHPGQQQFDGSAAHCIVCNTRGVYQDPNWASSPDRFEMSPDPEIAHLFYHILSNQQDDYEAIKIIIQSEHAPVDAIDNSGNTPLLLAAKNGNKRLCKFLLRNGADIYHQNEMGQDTVLHTCFWNGWDDLGMYLISKGADVLIGNANDQTCFEGDGAATTVPVHVQMALIAEAKEQLKQAKKNRGKQGDAISVTAAPAQAGAVAGAGWQNTPQGFGDEPQEERSFSL